MCKNCVNFKKNEIWMHNFKNTDLQKTFRQTVSTRNIVELEWKSTGKNFKKWVSVGRARILSPFFVHYCSSKIQLPSSSKICKNQMPRALKLHVSRKFKPTNLLSANLLHPGFEILLSKKCKYAATLRRFFRKTEPKTLEIFWLLWAAKEVKKCKSKGRGNG